MFIASSRRRQKAELNAGDTDLLVKVPNKSPATTFVVIDEAALEDRGIGGLAVEEYPAQVRAFWGWS